MNASFRRVFTVLLSGTIALTSVLVSSSTAVAAVFPVVDPATADVLPTAQINGVVWSTAINGNTVYAAGKFTQARPAGVAVGGAGTVSRKNLMSLDITTGKMTSWNPSLNAQAMVVTVSPDGSRIYVGGDFTTASGVARSHLAAYSTSTGALISSWNAGVDGKVRAIAVSSDSSTVYVGGDFTSAAGNARSRLAAFTSAGALTAWKPTTDNVVESMVFLRGKLAVGGRFAKLNGTTAIGMGFLSTAGKYTKIAATSIIKNSGNNAAIGSMSTDGTNLYITGWAFGQSSNLEGTAVLDPGTGAIKWMEDCHGDSYDAFARGGAVYVVSHAHDCSTIGGFPQQEDWKRALSFTNARTTTITATTDPDYHSLAGQPGMTLNAFYPLLTVGTFTGQSQAAWTLTGNDDYLLLAGEFLKAGATAQQGLVRYPSRSIAPKKVGPAVTPAELKPTLSNAAAGQVKVTWKSAWDRDNQSLSYSVRRDGVDVGTVTGESFQWARPTLTFTDTGVGVGSHSYTVLVSDGSTTITGSATAVSVTKAAAAVAARVATTDTVDATPVTPAAVPSPPAPSGEPAGASSVSTTTTASLSVVDSSTGTASGAAFPTTAAGPSTTDTEPATAATTTAPPTTR